MIRHPLPSNRFSISERRVSGWETTARWSAESNSLAEGGDGDALPHQEEIGNVFITPCRFAVIEDMLSFIREAVRSALVPPKEMNPTPGAEWYEALSNTKMHFFPGNFASNAGINRLRSQ